MNSSSLPSGGSLSPSVALRQGVMLALGLHCAHLAAAPPVVSNIRASQRGGTQLIDIYYNLSDPDSGSATVYVSVSADAGATYNLPVATLTGNFGPGVSVGVDRHIVWNAGVDWGGQFSTQCKVRITADDGSGPGTLPPGGAAIRAQ